MADRFKFAEVRQQVIEMLKTDLLVLHPDSF